MRLEFLNARLERDPVRGPYDLLLGVVADVTWTVGDRVLFTEELMPVVELALALRGWLDRGLPNGDELSYDSIEADESGLIWSRPEGAGWRVGALHQEYPEVTVWSAADVAQLFGDFVERVERWLRANVGVGLEAAQ